MPHARKPVHQKSRRRPFRGATPSNVFQTVDLGAGDAEYLRRQSKKYLSRKYAVVDDRYVKGHGIGLHIQKLPPNLHVQASSNVEMLCEMIKNNIRTRHINIDMPYPNADAKTANSPKYFSAVRKLEYDLRRVFEYVPKVLFPNGKIFVITENQNFVAIFYRLAAEYGFSVREKRLPVEHAERKTRVSSILSGQPIYQLTLTNNLRTAIPNKKVRRMWPSG